MEEVPRLESAAVRGRAVDRRDLLVVQLEVNGQLPAMVDHVIDRGADALADGRRRQ